jgi:lipopolysaccharide export system protein LptA
MKSLFSIERTRNLILVVGSLLFLVVAVFLLSGQWKRHFLLQDLPHRLGADIQLQANQFDYTQTRRGKTLFRIHAERAEQTRKSGETMLHNVQIEFFNPQGERQDTIRGDEFRYNQSAGIAVAQCEVDIDVRNPSHASNSTPTDNSSIHIRTSGLSFNQKTEVATTSRKLDFLLPQGNGSAVGATYDAAHGKITLNSAVEIHVQHNSAPISVHADHALMERTSQSATLLNMRTDYSDGVASSGLAHILFRADGSVASLNASKNVHLHTNSDSDAQAPEAVFQFSARSQPTSGVMSGGTTFQMNRDNRRLSGKSPRAQLYFDGNGQLQTAKLLDGAELQDHQTVSSARKSPTHIVREWRSETADLQFAASSRETAHPKPHLETRAGTHAEIHPAVQLQQIRGDGHVYIVSTTLVEGQPPRRSSLAADHVQAFFSAAGLLRRILGFGDARYHETTGLEGHPIRQWTSTSDTLEALLIADVSRQQPRIQGASSDIAGASQIERIVQDGHVRMNLFQASSKPGKPASTMHAFASHSIYDGESGVLHLTGTSNAPPQLLGDNFSLLAQSIDLDRIRENALAQRAVQATWTDNTGTSQSSASSPVHVLASEAALDGHAQQITFTGTADSPVHLWQEASSITAPKIVLNRTLQTLDAEAVSPDRSVYTVLAQLPQPAHKTGNRKDTFAHILRFTSGSVHESFAQQLAVFSSGVLPHVTIAATASGGPARIFSDSVRVYLHSDQSHATGLPRSQSALSAVDRMICRGQVRFSSPGRTGSGERLDYTSEDSTMTLTGTSTQDPQMTDQLRGTVSGRTIRFHLDNDSLSILDASGTARSTAKQR